jgi:hypothetical protein
VACRVKELSHDSSISTGDTTSFQIHRDVGTPGEIIFVLGNNINFHCSVRVCLISKHRAFGIPIAATLKTSA